LDIICQIKVADYVAFPGFSSIILGLHPHLSIRLDLDYYLDNAAAALLTHRSRQSGRGMEFYIARSSIDSPCTYNAFISPPGGRKWIWFADSPGKRLRHPTERVPAIYVATKLLLHMSSPGDHEAAYGETTHFSSG
jgi:hypothetical protein